MIIDREQINTVYINNRELLYWLIDEQTMAATMNTEVVGRINAGVDIEEGDYTVVSVEGSWAGWQSVVITAELINFTLREQSARMAQDIIGMVASTFKEAVG